MVDMPKKYISTRSLRSDGNGLLIVPRAKTKIGEAAFSFFFVFVFLISVKHIEYLFIYMKSPNKNKLYFIN